MRGALAAALLAAALVAGCYDEPVAITTPSPTPETILTPTPTTEPVLTPTPAAVDTPVGETPTPEQTPIELPTPTPEQTPIELPTPSAIAGGPPSERCRDGWVEPSPVDPQYEEGVAILQNYMGVSGPWVIDAIRYFTGPDSPGIIEPRYDPVQRWYIKASLVQDPNFRGRWILEKRTDLVLGVSAVAPYDTVGYQSPDWTAFVGEGLPQTYIGLPGQWSGIPYDFVTGEGDSGNPGLPDEVVDCLAGI